jgi:hypothetical protein
MQEIWRRRIWASEEMMEARDLRKEARVDEG